MVVTPEGPRSRLALTGLSSWYTSVVQETSFLQFKKATASLGFIGKPAPVVNPMVLFILFPKWDLVQKVYNDSKMHAFQGMTT